MAGLVVDISKVRWGYKPIYNWGRPSFDLPTDSWVNCVCCYSCAQMMTHQLGNQIEGNPKFAMIVQGPCWVSCLHDTVNWRFILRVWAGFLHENNQNDKSSQLNSIYNLCTFILSSIVKLEQTNKQTNKWNQRLRVPSSNSSCVVKMLIFIDCSMPSWINIMKTDWKLFISQSVCL